MGRGRAKAKQTKVARELKYTTPQTDFDALRRELSGSESSGGRSNDGRYEDSDEDGADDYRR